MGSRVALRAGDLLAAYTLNEIDLLRERLGVGYAQAKDALDASGGDVIGALAALESRDDAVHDMPSPDDIVSHLAEEVRRLLRGGRIAGLRLKVGEEALGEVPVAVAGVGAVFLVATSALLTCLRVETIGDDASPRTDSGERSAHAT